MLANLTTSTSTEQAANSKFASRGDSKWFAAPRGFWLFAALVALVALVLGTYWPVTAYDFVNWDDPWYVLKNPYIESWHPSNLLDIATCVINRNYSPVIIFSLLIERTLFGLDASGYHVVNVLLHALNAVLVCVLVSRLTKSRSIGWGTAALFAVHPVQLESVAWISSLKGLVCGTFILAHLICWLRPERTAKQDLWGLIFFLLALLSKALTVVVPAIVLLYDVFCCRRKFRKALARQLVPGVLSIWMLQMTMSAQVTVLGGLRDHLTLGRPQILAVDTVILWKYVGLLVWPSSLSVLYDQPTTGITGQIVAASIGWLLTAAAVWQLRRRVPLAFVACCAWLLLLLPVLNLTPITTLINDRYLYMPSIPFFACGLCGLRSLWSLCRTVFRSRVGLNPGLCLNAVNSANADARTNLATTALTLQWLPLGAAIAALMVASRAHLPVWQNDRALWEHTARQAPNLPLVQFQYAMMRHNLGDTETALAVLRRTLTELAPDKLDQERFRQTLVEWSDLQALNSAKPNSQGSDSAASNSPETDSAASNEPTEPRNAAPAAPAASPVASQPPNENADGEAAPLLPPASLSRLESQSPPSEFEGVRNLAAAHAVRF